MNPSNKLDEVLNAIRQGLPITVIDLSQCDLPQLPDELALAKDSVERLVLSKNKLTTLPDYICEFEQLQVIDIQYNDFETIPPVLHELPNLKAILFKYNKTRTISEKCLPQSLQWLTFRHNMLESLPRNFGDFIHMKFLTLSANQLSTLPNSMANCTDLEFMYSNCNQLTTIPSWLLTLPKLAWISLYGNPCTSLHMSACHSPLPAINWNDLNINQVIGEGASSHVYAGVWTSNGATTAVAVKMLKERMSQIDEEIRTMSAMGHHPNLIRAHGYITNHPERKRAIVIQKIPDEYQPLSSTSLVENIYDDYEPSKSFSMDFIVNVLTGVASAAAHLHSRYICHGDIFGHNILANDLGHCYLIDYGLATMYKDAALERDEDIILFEKIEVRAFSVLVDELLSRCCCVGGPSRLVANTITMDELDNLGKLCRQTDVHLRPTFSNILKILENR